MKRNALFVLEKLHDTYCLIPTGQAIADHKPSVFVNEVGAFLWNALSNDVELAELIRLSLCEYKETDEETLKTDVTEFINALRVREMIIDDTSVKNQALQSNIVFDAPALEINEASFVHTNIIIAGLKMQFIGEPKLLNDKLMSFASDFDEPDMKITLLPCVSVANGQEKILIKNDIALIVETENSYKLTYKDFQKVSEIQISKDYKQTTIHYRTELNEDLIREIYLSVRTPLALMAREHGMLLVHSASVLYNDFLYLFSAPAGTGKSTHAALWKETIGAPTINGDLNLCAVTSDNNVLVYGTPWCGTSEIYSTKTYPLGGIFFLKRAEIDKINELSKDEKIIRLMERVITPGWTTEMTKKNLEIAKEIASRSLLATLECTKNIGAFETIRDYLIEKL